MPYSSVSRVEEYRVSGDRVHLDCALRRGTRETLAGQQGDATATERTVPIAIRFYNPGCFRFDLHANPEVERRDRLIDLDEEAIDRPVDLETAERDGTLVLETDALVLEIGLDPWSFVVRDPADGRVLFEEQHEDLDAKDQRRVEPLGFREEEVTNWPYRVAETGTAFSLAADESLFGLGEKFTGFDKRGQTIESWTTQPNGSETEQSYKNVPFFLSTRGYGLLVDTERKVTFDLGDTSTLSGSIAVEDDALAFVFVRGPDFADIVETFTALTGRPHRPPKWSFGVWMSRYGYRSRDELEKVTDRLREEEIPCDVVNLDPYWMRQGQECDLTWDTDAFPDPGGMIDDLHEDGFHLSLWEHPYVAVGSDAFETAVEEGYLVTGAGGDPYVLDRLSVSTFRAGIVDFTDPAAAEWWREKHRDLCAMGVDVFKTDFGEYLPRDAVFANGRTGAAMRNVYPHLYQRTVQEAMIDANGPDDAIQFGRSGWTGSQRFPIHWPGDPRCTFGSMAACLRGGLSLGLSGYPFWAHDVGGFKGRPCRDLYVRWAQFGMLSSHTRFHGTTPREPWEFGEEAMAIVRDFAELRYRLLPYLYSYAERASDTGLPLMRPLVLHYQEDPAVHDIGDQYLLGDELLVAPVMDPAGTVDVYLPEGGWIDFFDDKRYEGGQTFHLNVPLDELPLFVRAGSLVPLRETADQTVPAGTPDRLDVRTSLESSGPTDATFPFYDEDADAVDPITVASEAGGTTVEFTTPAAPHVVATIRAVVEPPESVRADGAALERVEDEPAVGEWTTDGDCVVANLG